MRRRCLPVLVLAAGLCALPSLLDAQTPRQPQRPPRDSGGGVQPLCEIGCGGGGTPDVRISDHTFNGTPRPPESGPFSFTITLTNWSSTAGYAALTCLQLDPQLPCGTVSPAGDVYLAWNESQTFTVSFSTRGVGTPKIRYRVTDGVYEALSLNDSLTAVVPVAGATLQTHLAPAEGQTITTGDSLIAYFQSASGINAGSLKLFVDGVNYTSTSQVVGTTIRRSAAGFSAGTHRFTSYGCNNVTPFPRCDSVSTNFTIVGLPGPIALDDSLPAPDGEGRLGTLPGALPLPPMNLRGCPVNQGDPDIILTTPSQTVYQPTNPQGYLFLAGIMWQGTLSINATTADNLPTNPRRCAILPWVEYTGFDWNYWLHSDPNDPLWDSYPYGDRGGPQLRALDSDQSGAQFGPGGRVRAEDSDLDPQHPLFGVLRAQRQGTRPAGFDLSAPARLLRRPGVRSAATRRSPPRRVRSDALPFDGPGTNLEDAGAINPSTYWVTLNGTYIVQNGAPVYPGVVLVSQSRANQSFTIPGTAAIVNRYNPANPIGPLNHGWNEVVASIADSTGNRTSIRGRFAMVDPGPPMDIALTPLRNQQRQEQGDCAAFGSFQCGSNTLVQTIPGYVSRDRERALHLVYRSASQRAPLAVPYQIDISRYQLAPDSIHADVLQGGVPAGGPPSRYAGTVCSGSCSTFSLLDELANERRVITGELPATSAGDAFGPVTMSLRAFYSSGPRDNSHTQDMTRIYWTDTVSTQFGNGWQLAELGRLLFGTGSGGVPLAVYARGDGSNIVFRRVGGVWVAPPGVRARLVDQVEPADYVSYVIYFPDGTAVGFEGIGLQRFSQDLIGNRTYFSFQGPRLIRITEPNGFRFEFYDDPLSPGRVRYIYGRNPIGTYFALATLEYDAGRLFKLHTYRSDPDWETWQFGYHASAPGAYLTSVTDPRGNVTNYGYDPRFWTPISTARPPFMGVRDTAHYRDPLRRAAPREGWGRGSNPQERLVGPNQARGTFLGIATTPTDFQVDRFGAPTMVRHFAPPTALGYPFQADDLRHIDRDTVGRVTKIVAGRGYYGSNADSVRYEYDGHGNLARLIRPTAQFPAGANTQDTTAYLWDSVTTGLAHTNQRCVRMRRVTDPVGSFSQINYGTSGVAQCLPTQAIGLANDTTTFRYGPLTVGNPNTVRPVWIRQSNGVMDSVVIDASSWNTYRHFRINDWSVRSTVTSTDAQGRPLSTVDALGVTTEVRRDRYGRVLLARAGSGPTATITATFYGNGGLVDSVRVYGNSGLIENPPTTPVQTTRYRYNALGWVDTTYTPGGRKQYARYNRLGQPYFEYTGQGGFVGRLYDFLGRVTTEYQSQSRPGYSVDGQQFADAATNTAYINFGLTPGFTLNAGEVHRYSYDERGRLITMNDSLVTTQRTYNAAGALTTEFISFADGAQVRRRFEYNRRGQRTQAVDSAFVTATGAHLGMHRVNTVWNATTGLRDSMIGRIGATPYATVDWRYTRSFMDTLRTIALAGPYPWTLRTRWFYDGVARTTYTDTWREYPSGNDWYSFHYPVYDAGDRLTNFRTYETLGAPEAYAEYFATLGYATDGTGRLVSSTRAGPQPTNYTWRYDVFGNRQYQGCTSSQSTCQNADTVTFGIDNRIQLLRNPAPTTDVATAWYHDNAGNRLIQLDSTCNLTPPCQYIGHPTALLSYTARGQLFFSMTPSADPVNWDFNWHWYNGAGLRVITHAQGGNGWIPGLQWNPAANRTYYIYDGADVSMTLVRTVNPVHGIATWRVHQRFLSGGVDQPLAGYFQNNGGTSGGALAFVTDYQGSIRAAVRPDGLRDVNAAYFARNAWGNLEGASGSGGGSSGTNTETGYTGASTPNATGGFTYLRNRWYDGATGRFLTQDPIGLAGGINLYAYAASNPVSFSDPFGLFDVTGSREAMAEYERGKAQMAACADMSTGRCGAKMAARAAQGLERLTALENDRSINIEIRLNQNSPYVPGGTFTRTGERSGYISINSAGIAASDNYQQAAAVVHEVHEAGGVLNGVDYRYAHKRAVRFAEDPSLEGGNFPSRTSRSPDCNIRIDPAPFTLFGPRPAPLCTR